ncbi:MAG: hypothetical protein QM723_16160 [Myxococcaceae bacterium]
MIMIESRAWGSDTAQASQLKAKINAYAGFIMDGTLARQYPETAGLPVDIQLNCHEAPRGEFATILDHAARQLQRLGVGLRVTVTAKQPTH